MKRMYLFLAIIALILIGTVLIYKLDFTKQDIRWGVTFSPYYAQDELGLDWKTSYTAILDDLKVDHIRLAAYWNRTESERGQYDFSDLDWQVEQASARNVGITLAVGRRLPRWPECHDPSWLKDLSLTEAREAQLQYIEAVIKRYNDNPSVARWQIENEPFLGTFGECPPLDKELFTQEIALARSLTDKPLVITDSGELSSWIPATRSGGDILGTTLYRTVHNKYIGYWHWPLPSAFYTAKSWAVKKLSNIEKVIVIELQTEAWHTGEKTLVDMNREETDASLSIEQFNNNITYTQRAGFDEVYLWGVEWWYYLKAERGESDFWDQAKMLWVK